jgi:hypothetical protein
MRGVVALVAVLAAAVGCGAGQGAPAATPGSDLQITLWLDGRGKGESRRWSLECNPDAGTLPKRGAACDKLASMRAPFAPLRKDMACTEIYGGPQQALVTGRHRGQRIWVLLGANNGCQIARWNKLKFLVGGTSVGA